ncbi:NAD(P)-binding protein [Pseudovirgaria hyperparasitica]|uniref:NAD(P)-binding protein n=1 Tax=Pseudovirgaria hyperparasitica TaxID=470096 RepID=A0A6A6WD73_9PEZI|nr:NAD(P)-binding protein [Pseudovirgaria hyperparasitica]KAF2760129.1 NAD(P)-binding protein [Pseudovirgaria hyperparasitica]
MAPIRLGIIGLNASSSWAVNAHLPYLRKSSKYIITALCNSSADSARAAIKAHSLADNVAAYGSPEDLAKDPNVDLVVCSVRVDRHYQTLLPSVKAGKDVFCEWPLGKNLAEAEELAKIAKESGSKTMIGLQALSSPFIKKVKALIDEGKIGKVLSSTFTGAAYNGGPQEWAELRYITTREIGGNVLTIHFMHSIEGVFQVLGDLATYSSIIDTKRPKVDLTDKVLTDPSRKVVETVTRTSPDQFLVQGHFKSGALFSYHLRGGKSLPGEGQGLDWRIYGETGEIKLTAGGAMMNVGHPDTKIQLYQDGGELVEVQADKDEWSELPQPAQNIARIYEAFADGRTDNYLDWETAVVRHKLIDELYRREAAGAQDSVAEYIK